MKRYFVFLFVIIHLTSYCQIFAWAKQFTGDKTINGASITYDNKGFIYTTGYFGGSRDFDPGPGVYNINCVFGTEDIFITKLDQFGNFVWAKSFDGSNQTRPSSIKVDKTGNIIVTGRFLGYCDFDPGPLTYTLGGTSAAISYGFLTKLDPAGNLIWAKHFGNNYSVYSDAMAIDKDNNIYIAGKFGGTFDFDPGPGVTTLSSAAANLDGYICKFDSLGNFIWAKQTNATKFAHVKSISVDNFGGVYTTGQFNGTCDFDPGPGTFSYTANSDGSGGTFETSFNLKLNSSGNFEWVQMISGNDVTTGLSVACTGSGSCFYSGLFGGTMDFDPGSATNTLTSSGIADVYVMKVDSSGNLIFAEKYGGTGGDMLLSSTLDNKDNIYLSGFFPSTVDFDPGPGTANLTALSSADTYISKLDSSGVFLWARQLSAPGTLNCLTVDSMQNIYSTGNFGGTVDFDPNSGVYNLTVGMVNQADVFVLKLNNSIVGFEETSGFRNLKIYPNPTNGNILIDLLGDPQELTVGAKNILGQEIYSQSFTPNNKVSFEIIGESGMYFIEVKNKAGEIAKFKIIKT